MSLIATRYGQLQAKHDSVPQLHEGWLRLASVLQPLRGWTRGARRHRRVPTVVPSVA